MLLAVAPDPREPSTLPTAAALAAELGLPLADPATDPRFLLICRPDGLQLQRQGPGAPGPLCAALLDPRLHWRLRHGGGKSQLIARAVGCHRGARPQVLDATAGLGRDALVLAGLGCRVTLLERSPAIGALLRDGLARLGAGSDPELAAVAGRMDFHAVDALDYLRGAAPEVVYLDPMYPGEGRGAGVKKEMGLFRELLGEPDDESGLLEAALAAAELRVVVKRMSRNPSIAGPAPSYQLRGKSTRYDIYALKRFY